MREPVTVLELVGRRRLGQVELEQLQEQSPGLMVVHLSPTGQPGARIRRDSRKGPESAFPCPARGVWGDFAPRSKTDDFSAE